jgi:hypothetical protein
MSELEEAKVEALKWRTLAETRIGMEGIGEGIDQFHLEETIEKLTREVQNHENVAHG